MKPKRPPQASLHNKKISEILTALPDQFTGTKVTVGDLQAALSSRAYGVLLLVLALPNLVPIPAPGLSVLLGLPLALLTAQIVLGLKSPWFPAFISKRGLKTAHVKTVCQRVVPWVKKLERFIRPRLSLLTTAPVDRLIALICFVLSLMIMMPIPFGNAFPALAICLFAIGILQDDGVCILAGLVVTAISATVIAAFLGGILLSVQSLLGL